MDAMKAIADVYKMKKDVNKALETMERFVELQEKYYADLSTTKTEDLELLESIDALEKDYLNDKNEAKLMSMIDNQRYHKNVLYVVVGVAVIALLLLVLYRKKIN
jgi:hypothetical protein